MSGCKKPIKDSWWKFCGETDMGQTMPVLCKECGGDFEVDEAALNEQCRCAGKLDSHKDWQHHKQYCPIWKNGRIEELEKILIMFDAAFIAEDIHDLGKAHEKTVEALKQ